MGCIWESQEVSWVLASWKLETEIDWIDQSIWWIPPPDGLKTIGRWFWHSVRNDGEIFNFSTLCIFVSSVIPPFIFLLLSKSGWSLFQPILPPVTWKSVWLVCWRLSHIVEQKRRLVWGATVVYCKTCFLQYTNWESTQKVRVFFHIEEEITALQRKQLCRINLLPLLLNSSLEQLSQYVKCQLHWLLAPPFSSSSPLLVSQVRWTKCTERMPRKGIKDVQNLVTRKQDRRQKQNFDTYTKITNLMWKIMQKMFFKLMAEKT